MDPSKRNPRPFVVAGSVAIVVVVALVAVLILTSGASGSAKDTAEQFIAAAKANDCEKALTLISEDLKKRENTNCADSPYSLVPPRGTDIRFSGLSMQQEAESTATATVRASLEGETRTLTIELVKHDGDWKVDQIG